MNIVLEGIDNAGKSTLASRIALHTGWPIQPSEGPPKYPGEMNVRLERYQNFTHCIFDRHPIVSQSIYRNLRTGIDPQGMEERFVTAFYASKPVFVYCDPGDRGMEGHTFNDGVDSEEHLRQVEEKYTLLLKLYRDWAINHALFLYRIGDDMDQLSRLVYQLVGGK